jgi:hypothetical protein
MHFHTSLIVGIAPVTRRLHFASAKKTVRTLHIRCSTGSWGVFIQSHPLIKLIFLGPRAWAPQFFLGKDCPRDTVPTVQCPLAISAYFRTRRLQIVEIRRNRIGEHILNALNCQVANDEIFLGKKKTWPNFSCRPHDRCPVSCTTVRDVLPLSNCF